MKYSKKDIEESKARLREWLPEGSTVHTILRSVSRSGMSRTISVVVIKGNETYHPNYAVACVLGESLKRVCGSDAVKVNGCGMDMGFDLVYRLARAIHGDGYKLNHRWL